MTPIIQARIVWRHADAPPESRQLARDSCHRHVEFFIESTFAQNRVPGAGDLRASAAVARATSPARAAKAGSPSIARGGPLR